MCVLVNTSRGAICVLAINTRGATTFKYYVRDTRHALIYDLLMCVPPDRVTKDVEMLKEVKPVYTNSTKWLNVWNKGPIELFLKWNFFRRVKSKI